MQDIGRGLFIVGLGIAAIGGAVWLLGRAGFRGLPGDVRYESSHVRVYVPIVSCLVLSAVLTAAMWVWQWFQRK